MCTHACLHREASPPAGSGDRELQQSCLCQAGRGVFTLGPERSLDLSTLTLCVVLPEFVVSLQFFLETI